MCVFQPSPSPRRAWIEIKMVDESTILPQVALPAEGVDRNTASSATLRLIWSSPSPRRAWIEIHHGGQRKQAQWSPSPRRAWIEISLTRFGSLLRMSPSPRRAWIEIVRSSTGSRVSSVALPAEGVDRNQLPDLYTGYTTESPSPRRAWIEIDDAPYRATGLSRRPPRGGRG